VGIGTASPLNALQIGSANPITMNGNYPDIHFNGYYAAPHYRAVTTGYSTRMAFNPSNGSLSFKVGSNSTSAGANYNPIERVTLDKDGHLLVGDGITLGNGQTYAAANTLSDYETGTWTPAYTSGSSGYSNQVGRYTKIGEQVTAYFYLQMNNNQVGGSTLHVGGLPFTCNSDPSYGAASGMHCNSWSTSANKPDNGLVAPNNALIDLYHSQGTTATNQPVGNDIGNGSLIGCIVYRTSS
jgi:hypothetical protein